MSKKPTDILIIKEQFGSLILEGKKTWELRGSNTKKRGCISIAYSKTLHKYGEVDLIDSIPLTKELYEKNYRKHCSDGTWESLKKRYKNPHAWVMKNPKLYSKPKTYVHPNGAVIWVKDKN